VGRASECCVLSRMLVVRVFVWSSRNCSQLLLTPLIGIGRSPCVLRYLVDNQQLSTLQLSNHGCPAPLETLIIDCCNVCRVSSPVRRTLVLHHVWVALISRLSPPLSDTFHSPIPPSARRWRRSFRCSRHCGLVLSCFPRCWLLPSTSRWCTIYCVRQWKWMWITKALRTVSA
jgi:hypothetical protein